MNFIKWHLGDYIAATAHLSWDEDCAYRRLLDVLYKNEVPLPTDIGQTCRLVRATTPEQRQAVEQVLGEFFTLTTEGWRQTRADKEIAAATAQAETNLRIALEREAKRRERDVHEPSTSRARNVVDSCTSQTPDTRLQTQTQTQTQTPDPALKEPSASSLAATPTPTIPCPYTKIVELYHSILPELPQVKIMSDARQKAMRKRWAWILSSTKSDGARRAENADQALQWLKGYFSRASANDWLMGRSARTQEHANWQCDLDYLMSDKALHQVVEKTREAA